MSLDFSPSGRKKILFLIKINMAHVSKLYLRMLKQVKKNIEEKGISIRIHVHFKTIKLKEKYREKTMQTLVNAVHIGIIQKLLRASFNINFKVFVTFYSFSDSKMEWYKKYHQHVFIFFIIIISAANIFIHFVFNININFWNQKKGENLEFRSVWRCLASFPTSAISFIKGL